MQARAPRTQALLSLFAAHRELTLVELSELRQNLASAAVWGALAAAASLVAWIGVNVTVVLLFRERPWVAVAISVGMNLVVAVVGALRARALLRRPVLPLTRSEAARDVRSVLEAVL